MLINKHQRYLLGFVLVTTLSANVQSVSALNTNPVKELESSATSLSTEPTSTSISVLNATFAPLATAGLHIFNGNQYKPEHDGKLFKNTDTMPVTMKEVVANFTVSKYEKAPVVANKVFLDSQYGKEMMVVSTTPESQPNQNGHPSEQNQSYLGKPQYRKRGTLVSTNYNSASMQRTMEDSQSISYIGITDVNAASSNVPENSCTSLEDLKLLATCQNKNQEKTTGTMPMIHEQNWSAQMNQDFSFSQNMNMLPQKVSK